jgi:NAD(P)-dependent dehydrogenase (short-subunit alcohol dehydrogenase family)
MKRAVILGGTGVLGRAIAWRLISSGWAVDITGRTPGKMPAELANAGARFLAAERRDAAALAEVIGAGADLLVDAACYTEADAEQLLPHLGAITSQAPHRDVIGRRRAGLEERTRHADVQGQLADRPAPRQRTVNAQVGVESIHALDASIYVPPTGPRSRGL